MLTVSLLVCVMVALSRADGDVEASVAPTDAHASVAPTDAHASVAPTDAHASVAPTDAHASVAPTESSASVAPSAPANSSEDLWQASRGHSYLFVQTPLSWAEAEQNCLNKTAHLASVQTFDEYQFIQGMIQTITLGFPETWLGASNCQQEDTWLWSDGSHFEHSLWCVMKPDKEEGHNCLQMNYGANSCWDNTNCTLALPSVCAK
ncbi:type-2 ice-structuring protein-like [Pempheris klunzingeri]|uniref:type-2 ice-structuring protein-like n=1 Tax=Pempheris klunzingeri TaxID=3127111 RepID=UPI00397F72E9